jgi:NAD(P)-dependent dehydrogenase (short-subunit alcohol dehydrogenase family)
VRALVTGAAGGIGRALVTRARAEGYEVDELDLVSGFDVTDPAAWETVRPPQLAFLNAGVTASESDPAAFSDDEYRRIVGVNVDGVVLGVRRLAQTMEPGGGIVVTGSLAGLVDLPGDPLYALTKHAVVGFVRSVAARLAERGLRINMVNPGIVDTPMIDHSRAALAAAGFPLLRPEEVAEAAWRAATSVETGQAWIVQPGREPLVFRFPGVPGPRTAGAEGMRPPSLGPGSPESK